MDFPQVALYPDFVKRIRCICGSARTLPHNWLYLNGYKTIMECADGWEEGRRPTWPAPPADSMRIPGISPADDAFVDAEVKRLLEYPECVIAVSVIGTDRSTAVPQFSDFPSKQAGSQAPSSRT